MTGENRRENENTDDSKPKFFENTGEKMEEYKNYNCWNRYKDAKYHSILSITNLQIYESYLRASRLLFDMVIT